MPPKSSSIVLVLALALSATTAAPGSGSGGSTATAPDRPMVEPSATFNLGVRLIRLTGQGATRRALVELNLFSRTELEGLRIDRASGRTPGPPATVSLPENSRTLTAWSARKVQLSVDLEEGRVHHLRFTASGEERTGGSRSATAYLRLNLDTDSMGSRLDMEDHDLIQYGPARGGE